MKEIAKKFYDIGLNIFSINNQLNENIILSGMNKKILRHVIKFSRILTNGASLLNLQKKVHFFNISLMGSWYFN